MTQEEERCDEANALQGGPTTSGGLGWNAAPPLGPWRALLLNTLILAAVIAVQGQGLIVFSLSMFKKGGLVGVGAAMHMRWAGAKKPGWHVWPGAWGWVGLGTVADAPRPDSLPVEPCGFLITRGDLGV